MSDYYEVKSYMIALNDYQYHLLIEALEKAKGKYIELKNNNENISPSAGAAKWNICYKAVKHFDEMINNLEKQKEDFTNGYDKS